MSNAERLLTAIGAEFPEGDIEMNLAVLERMLAALAPISTDDFVTLMTGPDESFERSGTGPDGLREAWADWLDTFGSVRFEIEGVEEVGASVLMLGKQTTITRHGGVEIEQPSAALWKFRDDKLVRIEFHLDRDRAYESAREPA